MADHGGNTAVLMTPAWGDLVDTAGQLCLPFVDQHRKARPIDANLDFDNPCDLGAVEFEPESAPIPPAELFSDGFE